MQDELEDIKRRKLAEMQRQYQEQIHQQLEEEHQAQQQIAALEEMLKRKMSKEALQRYGNIKTADPEKAVEVLVVLGRLMQLGKIREVSDESLRAILEKMSSGKRNTTITRK